MRERFLLVMKLGVVLIIQCGMVGCKTGGSGGVFGVVDGFGFFGGGESGSDGAGDAPTLLNALSSSDTTGSGSGAPEGSGTDSIVTSAAAVHNPEPASLALFGGGLAGLAYGRRRKQRRSG